MNLELYAILFLLIAGLVLFAFVYALLLVLSLIGDLFKKERGRDAL